MMKRIFLFMLVLVAASCVRRDDLSYDGIESVKLRSVGTAQTDVDVFVRASNASGTTVTLVRADLELSRDESVLLRASVDEKVKLPRRSEDVSVRIPVRVRFEGGMLGALGVMKTLSRGASGTVVSGTVIVRAGAARKKYRIEKMETDRFLHRFGIDLSDISRGIGL
ncbi:hypothetical protein [uncultured Alistipes sp.]|uniref:hypothetical protein n=1 Tax=uncultured Alistipes sp. TaxID=538949 RepID=UPI00261BBB80|nr:hypothetical protein [uncultured Alistipes sp.]